MAFPKFIVWTSESEDERCIRECIRPKFDSLKIKNHKQTSDGMDR